LEVWKSNLKVVEECPFRKKKVVIPPKIYRQLMSAKKIETEVILFLKIKNSEDVIKVEEIKIPKQRVSIGSCKALEDFPECQGVFHTHPMQAFFSGIDEEHLNANNVLSLVLGRDGEMKASIREKVPCGILLSYEAEIEIEEDLEEKFIRKIKEKIVEEEESQTLLREEFWERWIKNGLYL